MALAATVLALALQQPAIKPDHPVCATNACERRVSHRWTRRRWRRIVRPYRGWLRSTRRCESGGRYHIDTGNGFYGAYQFTLRSWRAVGGHGYPHRAEPLEQDYRAVRLLRLQGRGAWPVCG
jgi:hypothetical protein